MSLSRPRLPLLLIATAFVFSAGLLHAAAQPSVPANAAFQRTWERTDYPVSLGPFPRTWMWGPFGFTGGFYEPYADSPDGQRVVQYFDKSRMEITTPGADSNSPWYVTNGLLVIELITGQLQTGNASFEQRQPANVNVAGDADDDAGFTYSAFASILDQPPAGVGTSIDSELTHTGGPLTWVPNPTFAIYDVTAAVHVPETSHTVASVFWDFMTSTGIVYENGQFVTAPLFLNAFYATGFPITEANWVLVKVGGDEKPVLIQCFERRCLTYTPSNAPEWRVEAGNVGQHYYTWRYNAPVPQPPPPPPADPPPPPPPPDPEPDCDPSYPTVCIPPPPPDLDCGDITARNFVVLPPDPHGFDGDNDGIGCES